MNISLGIFDVFANAVPGSLYVLLTLYASVRLGWVDLADVNGLNTTLATLGGALLSYLVGQVFCPTLRRQLWRVPATGPFRTDGRSDFVRRNPGLAGRPFSRLDPFTLLAGVRDRSPAVAVEIDRLRASGQMLGGASPALALGAVVAAVEAARGPVAAPAAAAAVLAVGSVLALRESRKYAAWAQTATYEAAAWLPEEPSPATHVPVPPDPPPPTPAPAADPGPEGGPAADPAPASKRDTVVDTDPGASRRPAPRRAGRATCHDDA
jgi:hypothetical protein